MQAVSEAPSKRSRLEALFVKDKMLVGQSASEIAKVAKKQIGLQLAGSYVTTIRNEFRERANGNANGHNYVKPELTTVPVGTAEVPPRPKVNIEDMQKVAAFARTIGGIDKLLAVTSELQTLTQGL